MAMEMQGYETRYYVRKKRTGKLEYRTYRTKSLTDLHTQIRRDYGGVTRKVEFDPKLYKETMGMLGTFLDKVPGHEDPEAESRFNELQKEHNEQARAERKARLEAKRAEAAKRA